MSARRDEDVPRLDVAMHDAGAVRRIERVGDLDAQLEQLVERQTAVGQRVLQRRPSSRSIAMNGWPSCSPIS